MSRKVKKEHLVESQVAFVLHYTRHLKARDHTKINFNVPRYGHPGNLENFEQPSGNSGLPLVEIGAGWLDHASSKCLLLKGGSSF